MSIHLRVRFSGSKGKEVLNAVFDSRNTYSYIRQDLAEKIGTPDKLTKARSFCTEYENEFLNGDSGACLNFEIQNLVLSDQFIVVPVLKEEVIFGLTTLRKWGIKLNPENNNVTVNAKVAEFMLKELQHHHAYSPFINTISQTGYSSSPTPPLSPGHDPNTLWFHPAG
jgi:hypothetical protein